MRFKLSSLTTALVLIGLLPNTYADTQILPEIKIQSNQSAPKAYTVKNSTSATKLKLSTQETPQTVNVVTRQQIEDFNLSSTRDLLNSTPGVTVTGLETNRTTYTSRGFDISNIVVDGMGIPQIDSYNYNNSDPDSFFYDRVEVIKGADALTNGLGDPGATINYVRKQPTKDFQANASVSYGSWDTRRYDADLSGALTQDGRVRARLTAFEKVGNSYLDHYSEEKNGVQGIVEADLTDTTTASVGFSRTKQLTNGSQWGALPLVNTAGQQLSYSRSYNYAPDWAYYDWTINNYFAHVEQKLGGDWKAKLSYDQKDSNNSNQMLYLSGMPSGTNSTSGIYLYPEIYNQQYKDRTVDLNFNGTYGLWGQRHEANLGYSWSQHQVSSQYAYGSSLGVITTDLASWTPTTQTWGEFINAADQMFIMKSLYGATRLHFTDDLKLTLGANYTQIDNKNTFYKNKLLPYAGLTYNFTPNYTGYLSYTSIFRPQTLIDSTTQKVAVPVVGSSYELGLKTNWLNHRLTGSLAIFSTQQSNFALNPQYSATDSLYHSALGTVRSQGIELGLTGKVTDDLNIVLGYTKFSLKNTDTGVNPRQYNPTQSFNILATYTVPQIPQLKVGANIKWQDTIYDPATNNGYALLKQDAYALLGLMASYDVNSHFAVQVNGNNVTNKKYLTGLQNGQGYYGASANYNVALKFKY